MHYEIEQVNKFASQVSQSGGRYIHHEVGKDKKERRRDGLGTGDSVGIHSFEDIMYVHMHVCVCVLAYLYKCIINTMYITDNVK